MRQSASPFSVIAMSSAAAAAYVRDGYSNIRVAISLEFGRWAGSDSGVDCAGAAESSCRRLRRRGTDLFRVQRAVAVRQSRPVRQGRHKCVRGKRSESYELDVLQSGGLVRVLQTSVCVSATQRIGDGRVGNVAAIGRVTLKVIGTRWEGWVCPSGALLIDLEPVVSAGRYVRLLRERVTRGRVSDDWSGRPTV